MFTQDDVKVIEGINTIPIFNIENVRGKCIVTPNGNIQSLVLADDIAREGGLAQIETYYDRPNSGIQGGINGLKKLSPLIQGNEAELEHVIMPHNSGTQGETGAPHFCGAPIQGNAAELEHYQLYKIRWSTFNQYANDSIPSIQQHNPSILQYLSLPIKSGSYIPLEIALVVLMHLNSKKARDFQVILATRIAPELTAKAIQAYKQQLQQYQQQLNQYQERLQYYQNFVDTSTLYSTTEIAREFEMSPQQLRKILQDLNIIYPCNKTWQISGNFVHCDFVRNKAINNSNTNDHPYWTDGGRQFVIHILSKYNFIQNQNNGKKIIPLVLPINQLQ